MGREIYEESIQKNTISITEVEKLDPEKIKMTNGNIVKIDKAIKVTFILGTKTFSKEILTTPVILVDPIFVNLKSRICRLKLLSIP